MVTIFNNADEVIHFIKNAFGEDLNAVKAIREIDRGYSWCFVTGRCDICGVASMSVIPACGNVCGMECVECGNMSVYPSEDCNKNSTEDDDPIAYPYPYLPEDGDGQEYDDAYLDEEAYDYDDD